jgi:hypothetical protein
VAKRRFAPRHRELLHRHLFIVTFDPQQGYQGTSKDVSGLTIDLKRGTWSYKGRTYKIGCKRPLDDSVTEPVVVGVYDRMNDDHLNLLIHVKPSSATRIFLPPITKTTLTHDDDEQE